MVTTPASLLFYPQLSSSTFPPQHGSQLLAQKWRLEVICVAGQWGIPGVSCRDESVGLGRGDGSDDSLTLGRTKEEERRETPRVSIQKSLCRDVGEWGGWQWGVLPEAPTPTPLGPLPQELVVNTLPGKSKLGSGVQAAGSLGVVESRPGHIPGKVNPLVSTQCQAGLTSSGEPRPP